MAIFSIKESTAAQRYAERKMKEDIDGFSYKNADHLVKKGSNEKIKFAQKKGKEDATASDKGLEKKFGPKENSKFTDNQKAAVLYAAKAATKKLLGITNSEAKKRGMKIEDLKEACETILFILDESKSQEELEKETIESNKKLLAQYKKELNDLNNHSGIARMMNNSEIRFAKADLIHHIRDLESDLSKV